MIFDWHQGEFVTVSGGECDYPSEVNVLAGVEYGGGAYTGTLKKYSVTTDANDPLRQRIMDILTTRLATITTGNGYKTNAGNTIYNWKKTPLPDPATSPSKYPCITYEDSGDVPEDLAVGEWVHSMGVTLRAFAAGSTAEETLRLVRADLLQCIGADLYMSTLADDTRLEAPPSDIEVEHYEKRTAGIQVTIIIEFSTHRFSDYAK